MKCSFNGVTCKKSEWNVTTDTEREGTASSGRRCGGVLGSSKKEKEFMDMDNSVVIAGGRGVGTKKKKLPKVTQPINAKPDLSPLQKIPQISTFHFISLKFLLLCVLLK